MTIKENSDIKLFGFRISKTGTIILAFISLTLFIQFIPQLYYFIQSFLYYLYTIPISELLTNIGNLIVSVIPFILMFILVNFLITIFILCATIQKHFRSEDIFARWFFYRQTKSSIAVLFILSLVYIIFNSFNLYNYIITLIEIISFAPENFINYYIVLIIAVIILMIIHIYTLIVCMLNKETLI
ncbi:MAG: hypothetical protein ACFFA4_01175 [Promethearchaeota archaeon]